MKTTFTIANLVTREGKGQKVFMAEIFAFHGDKAVVQIAAIEIASNKNKAHLRKRFIIGIAAQHCCDPFTPQVAPRAQFVQFL